MIRVTLMCLVVLCAGVVPAAAQPQDRDAGRDDWNRPADVMDALRAVPGSVVADIGAGFGYFTFHLSSRVGPAGKVFATDIRNRRLDVVRERVAKDGLTNVEVMIGANDDPLLSPGSVDAILLSNSYHDFTDFNPMMQGMFAALKPGGRLVVLDADAEPGEPRRLLYQNAHHIPKQMVMDDAVRAGFRLVSDEPGFTPPARGGGPPAPLGWFFLVFEKP